MASCTAVPCEPLRRGEQARDDAAAGPQTRAASRQRAPRVAGELERVDAEHGVERGVSERQRLHVALRAGRRPGAGRARRRAGPGLMSMPLARGAAGRGQHERQAGAAADVEQPRAGAHLRRRRAPPRTAAGCAARRARPRRRGSVPHRRLLDGRGGADLAAHPRRLDVLVEAEHVVGVVGRLDLLQAARACRRTRRSAAVARRRP